MPICRRRDASMTVSLSSEGRVGHIIGISWNAPSGLGTANSCRPLMPEELTSLPRPL